MGGEIHIHPCPRHRSILSGALSWERALQVADDCPDCTVTTSH